MYENLSIQEIREKFDQCRSKMLLCKFREGYYNGNFVQVALDVISEEADFVQKIDVERNVFENNSKDKVCYVKFDYFRRFIPEEELDDIQTENDEEDYIEEFLRDKLVLINPYYWYNDTRDLFFKNGNISQLVPVDEIPDGEFYTIPIIPNGSYTKYVEKELFALPDVSKKIIGIPEYLYYDGFMFEANIDASDVNEFYWKKNEVENDNKINIDLSGFSSNEVIVPERSGYVFVSKNAVIKYQASKKKIIKLPVDESEKEKDKNPNIQVIGDDSDEGKINKEFYNFTKSKNLCYTLTDIQNFYTCVKTSQLIILAGMSGTGKTRLPLKFAEYFKMSEENGTLLFMPVSPSFTEPSDVLGFLNPNTGLYTSAETGLVEFLKHAQENPKKMHMVIFDEMNLAQIEFWFAPFISILEMDIDKRVLHLYSPSQRCINEEKYPSQIKIGNNIIFIGTINLDETTKNISDRLVDRSFIINLKKVSFANYQAQQSQTLSEDSKELCDKDDFYEFMPEANYEEFNYINEFEIKELEFFDKIHFELNKIDSQKGISFRCLKNIAMFIKNSPEEFIKPVAFDYAFKQTIMKKINGSIDNIGEFLGVINNDGTVTGVLSSILEEYNSISDFKETTQEIKNKIVELKKYGYAR